MSPVKYDFSMKVLFKVLLIISFFIYDTTIHAQEFKESLQYYPEKNLKAHYVELNNNGAYSVQISPVVDPPSNSNIIMLPFDDNKHELVDVAKKTFTELLMKYYPEICVMLEMRKIDKAVFYLSFYDKKELFDKFFIFFAVEKEPKDMSALNAFKNIVISDGRLRNIIHEAGSIIYSLISPGLPKEKLPADIQRKVTSGDEGYDFCNFIFVEIYPYDVENKFFDNLECIKNHHEGVHFLSLAERDIPVSNSKLNCFPFDKSDRVFQQICQDALVQSLKIEYPALINHLETGKLSEVRLTINLDDKGELVEKGFKLNVSTKFPTMIDILLNKIRLTTVLRQIVNKTSKFIYERCEVDFPRESLLKEVYRKVEAGEKGYGYYTKMEIRITKDDLKK